MALPQRSSQTCDSFSVPSIHNYLAVYSFTFCRQITSQGEIFIVTLGPFNRDGKVIEILAECCHQEEDADQLCKVVIENKLG